MDGMVMDLGLTETNRMTTGANDAESIARMTADQIETRRNQIAEEVKTADEAGLDALNAELDAMEIRSRELETLETRRANMAAVIAGAGTVLAKAPEPRNLTDILQSEAYLNAYAEDIKHNTDRECRALLTDLVSDGTVPIPTYISERIETAWQRMSILPRLRRTNIKGTAKYPFEYAATPAAVHTEGAVAPTEETLELGTVTISPQMIKKWITYSDEVEALKGQAFLDYVYNEIEYRILKLAEDTAIHTVKASPATTSKTAAGVPTLTVTAIDASTIFQAQALLADEATRPVAIMNKQTYFNQFMSLTDTTGRPIYNIVPENGRPSYYINGIEVLFSDTMTAGTELLVGDLDGMIINLPEGFGVKFTTDPYSLAESDLVKIVGRMYAGFGVVRSNFFVKVTVGT